MIVLAGPSGSGKSRLADRLGLPILRLDDFYKDGDDPTLPRLDLAGGEPIVDWDDPGSWNREAAVEAVEELCRTGCDRCAVYDISTSARTGHRVLDARRARRTSWPRGSSPRRSSGNAAAGACSRTPSASRQHPALTFVRRLARDLREHRKPPFVLVRRGLHLLIAQRAVVRHAQELGCRVLSPRRGLPEVRGLTA